MDELLPSPRPDYGPKSMADFLRLYLQYHPPKAGNENGCHKHADCRTHPAQCRCREGIAKDGW